MFKKISGFVHIRFRTKVSTNAFYLNQGPNLVVNDAIFVHLDSGEELTLLRRRFNNQVIVNSQFSDTPREGVTKSNRGRNH